MQVVRKFFESVFSKFSGHSKSAAVREAENDEKIQFTFGRDFRPSDDETFYHYCSMEILQEILQTKTLRFSDINMMNDYGETAYGYDIFIQAATQLLKSKENAPELEALDEEFLNSIESILGASQIFVHPVVACFSKNPDVLSQWRAYANNGRGVSIGFSGRILKSMPVTILEIEYDKQKQIDETVNAIATIFMRYKDSNLEFDKICIRNSQIFAAYLFAYKKPGFSEEQEVRCVHLLDIKRENDLVFLKDEGGTSGVQEVDGGKVKFRISDNGVIAYVDIPFNRNNILPHIEKIYVGPYNNNNPGNIHYLAGSEGFSLEIMPSSTTFRT